MTATATLTLRTQVAGVSITSTVVRNEENESRLSIPLVAGKTGTLSTRTDDDTGVLTVGADHGITDTDTVSVFWAGGSRQGMDVTATTATTISIDLGAGTVLPAATTAIVVDKERTHNVGIVGDELKVLAITCNRRSSVEFFSAADASLLKYDMAASEGRLWYSGADVTNPLAGDTVAYIKAANGEATAATLEIGMLRTTD